MATTDSHFSPLIQALADAAVEDYLRELASNDAVPAVDEKNPPLPPRREAA